MDFVLSSPKCPKWPKELSQNIQFPCKQYQNPSQYYKMLVVKIVWTDAATY